MEFPTPSRGARQLVIGVGNSYRRDDGAGIAVARLLQERQEKGILVCMLEREASDLLDSWEGMDQVVLVDAAHSGAPPGTIHRFDAKAAPLPAALLRFSTHSFGVAEAIELGRALGQLPGSLTVYGIAGQVFELGIGLSSLVEAAVADVADRVLQELNGAVSDQVKVNL